MRSVRKRYSVISASTITLEPGGVMLAGTSGFSRTVHPADVVEADGVGVLRNHAGGANRCIREPEPSRGRRRGSIGEFVRVRTESSVLGG